MKREPCDLSFETWITCIFGPAPDFALDAWDLEPALSVAYLTKLFEHATHVLRPFSDSHRAEGFWDLISARSTHFSELLNPGLAWAQRQRWISSLFTLFEHFFAPRCSSSAVS